MECLYYLGHWAFSSNRICSHNTVDIIWDRKSSTMDCIKYVALKFGTDYDLSTEDWLTSLLIGCYCDFKDNRWPLPEEAVIRVFLWSIPMLNIISLCNHTDIPDLIVSTDILKLHLYAHQLVSEQMRYTLNLAQELDKMVSIETALLDAANVFLSIENCPHENHGYKIYQLTMACVIDMLYFNIYQYSLYQESTFCYHDRRI